MSREPRWTLSQLLPVPLTDTQLPGSHVPNTRQHYTELVKSKRSISRMQLPRINRATTASPYQLSLEGVRGSTDRLLHLTYLNEEAEIGLSSQLILYNEARTINLEPNHRVFKKATLPPFQGTAVRAMQDRS